MCMYKLYGFSSYAFMALVWYYGWLYLPVLKKKLLIAWRPQVKDHASLGQDNNLVYEL